MSITNKVVAGPCEPVFICNTEDDPVPVTIEGGNDCCPTQTPTILCDANGSFYQFTIIDNANNVTVINTTLTGDPYTPVGEVTVCTTTIVVEGGDLDEKVKISSNDVTASYLINKLFGTADKITVTEVNDGGIESIVLNIGADVFDKTVDDAFDVSYTPSVGTDWPDPDPTNAGDALDELASRNIYETITGDGGTTTANTYDDTLNVAGGVGITTAVTPDTVTITNSAPKWITFNADVGSTSADTTTDVLTISGTGSTTTSIVGDTLTINSTVLDDATDINYTPDVPDNWPDPDPTTVQEALDSLADQATCNIRTVAIDTTILASDCVLLVDTSGGPVTIDAPLLANVQDGQSFVIKKITADINNVIIDGNGVNIDGAASFNLVSGYAAAKIVNDQTQWWII